METDNTDLTVAEAAAAEGSSGPDLPERLRSAVERGEAEAAADTLGDGGATSPSTEPPPQTVDAGGDPEAVEPPPEDSPAPPPDGWAHCPVCTGSGLVPAQLRHSVTARTCPDCNGIGQVFTGSLVAEAAVLQCDSCVGNGYVSVPRPPENPPPPQPDAWQSTY